MSRLPKKKIKKSARAKPESHCKRVLIFDGIGLMLTREEYTNENDKENYLNLPNKKSDRFRKKSKISGLPKESVSPDLAKKLKEQDDGETDMMELIQALKAAYYYESIQREKVEKELKQIVGQCT